MILKKIVLKNFRNIRELELKLGPRINLVIAPNGTGKTNLLEAIAIASNGKSPRTAIDLDIIPFDLYEKSDIPPAEFTKVSAFNNSEKYPKEIIFTSHFGNTKPYIKKSYRRGDKNTTRKKFREIMPCVYFSPESIGYLTLGHSKRRELFDSILSVTDLEYQDLLTNYKRALRNRNTILRKLQTNGHIDELLFWTKEIVKVGSIIIKKRWHLLEEYSRLLAEVSKKVLKNQWLSIEYLPHIDSTPIDEISEISMSFLADIKRLKQNEIAAGKTLKGPHRDKWIIKLDEKDISRYGSRGQQRVGILAIFLALHKKIKNSLDDMPILLLDDITSELDEVHIGLLKTTLIKGDSQVLLTSTQERVVDIFNGERDFVNVIRLDQCV